MIPLPAPLPPIVIADCPAIKALGCYYNKTVYLTAEVKDDRFVFYHELGHYVDDTMLNDGERNKFMRMDGMRFPVWWKTTGNRRNSGGELFADAYSHCAGGDKPGWWTFSTSYDPDRSNHRQICKFIQRAMVKP